MRAESSAAFLPKSPRLSSQTPGTQDLQGRHRWAKAGHGLCQPSCGLTAAGVLRHHPPPARHPVRDLFADVSEKTRLPPGGLTQLLHGSNAQRSDICAGRGQPLASWTLPSVSSVSSPGPVFTGGDGSS